MALSLWVAHRFAERPPQSPMLRHMVDDLARRSLLRAIRQLDEITRFEREYERPKRPDGGEDAREALARTCSIGES
jgi:hypothetical protein